MDAERVYRSYAPSVRGYLRGQGVAEADDLLSEVFLQVTRSLPLFEGADEELRPWIFAIARNRVIDAHRRRAVRPVTTGAEVPDLPGPTGEDPVDPDLADRPSTAHR